MGGLPLSLCRNRDSKDREKGESKEPENGLGAGDRVAKHRLIANLANKLITNLY